MKIYGLFACRMQARIAVDVTTFHLPQGVRILVLVMFAESKRLVFTTNIRYLLICASCHKFQVIIKPYTATIQELEQ